MNQNGQHVFYKSENDTTSNTMESIELITNSVCSLQSEIFDLQRIIGQLQIYIKECGKELESIRDIRESLCIMLSEDSAPKGKNINFVEKPYFKLIPNSKDGLCKPKYALDSISDKNANDERVNDNVMTTIKFTSDGSHFIFTCNKFLYIFNTDTGKMVNSCEINLSITNNEKHIKALAISPDDNYVALGSESAHVILFSLDSKKTFKQLHVFENHRNTIQGVAFSSDSNYLFSIGTDSLICKYDVRELKLIQSEPLPQDKDGYATSFAFFSQKESLGYFLVSFLKGQIDIYEPDLKFGNVCVEGKNLKFFSITLSDNDKFLCVTLSNDHSCLVYENSGFFFVKPRKLTGHDNIVLTSSFSPNCKYLFTGSKDETIRAWDIEKGELLFTLSDAHKNTIFEVNHHPTKPLFISCSGDGKIYLWEYYMN